MKSCFINHPPSVGWTLTDQNGNSEDAECCGRSLWRSPLNNLCFCSVCSWKNHHQRRAGGHVGEWQTGHLHRWCKHRTCGHFNVEPSASCTHHHVIRMQNGHKVRWNIKWRQPLLLDMGRKAEEKPPLLLFWRSSYCFLLQIKSGRDCRDLTKHLAANDSWATLIEATCIVMSQCGDQSAQVSKVQVYSRCGVSLTR